jgi:hypothetical protein
VGPYILSDRRYKDSKVVYYRYGGIQRIDVVNARGERVPSLVAPDGKLHPDKRLPYFQLPDWVHDPLMADAEQSPENMEPSLRDGRYLIEQALAFSNAGGVYLGTDRQTGNNVVIKEARPWVAWDPVAGDAVDLLKKEYRLLALLEDTGIAPKPIELFQEWEHYFLVEEHILGLTLSDHAADFNLLLRTRPAADDSSEFSSLYQALFRGIINIIEILHSRGIIFSDLSSRNLLVPKGTTEVKVIDFEAAYQEGCDTPLYLFTPGFASREQIMGKRPDRYSDYFSLGALALSYLMPINSVAMLNPDVLGRFLGQLRSDFGLSPALHSALMALLQQEVSQRATPACLGEAFSCGPVFDIASGEKQRAEEVVLDQQLLDRMADSIIASAQYERSDRLFPADAKGFLTNHVGIAHGACGVLHVLHKLGRGLPPAMLEWVERQPLSEQTLPQGLFVGSGGIAWVLGELGQERQAENLLQSSDANPQLLENPDLYHGMAGWGLSHLHHFLATGNEFDLQMSQRAVDHLRRRASKSANGVFWQVETDIPIGWAHGGSGIALFLLYWYLVTGDGAAFELGRQALEFDLRHGVQTRDGGLSWPSKVGLSAPLYPYLRYGTAGIGKVLVRYNHILQERRYREILDRMYLDVDRRYALFPGYLNGLAGLCDFLLDCYQFTGQERYRRSAEKTLRGIELFMFPKNGLPVIPGDGLMRLSFDWATGLAGVASVAHRYLANSKADFLLDEAFACTPLSLKVVA